MKITIPYQPELWQAGNGPVDTKTLQDRTEKIVMKGLGTMASCPEARLLYVCFQGEGPVKIIMLGVVILSCIQKKFPEYQPRALWINRLPSKSQSIEIEFANFRDIGRSVVE